MSNEDMIIDEDIEKLFAFQDKHLTKDKKAILVKALAESGIPTGAIVLGLRKLMYDDLPSIKMGIIINAARQFVEKTEDAKSCTECAAGVALLRDDQGKEYALACRCGSGFNAQRIHGIKRWGGQGTQMSNGRMLYKKQYPISRLESAPF